MANLTSNFNEFTITDAAIDRLKDCDSPRIKQISTAFIRHMHNFVREIEPTFDEWWYTCEFLTRTGQICDGNRREFVLLSDVLGISMLVDAINHRLPKGATESTVLGPFYKENPPEYPLGANISPGIEGEPLIVHGTVRSVDGAPLMGAVVDTWHSDSDGYYDMEQLDHSAMRGRLRTDDQGRFWFWTIVPKFYPIPDDGPVGELLEKQKRHSYRPAHVHFMISAPGHEKLTTHVFIAGSKYLDSDVVFGVKDSLIKDLERRPAGIAPDGKKIDHPFAVLQYDFALAQNRVSQPKAA